MPEYCVPYALHLLAFRHETASAAGTLAGEDDSDVEMDNIYLEGTLKQDIMKVVYLIMNSLKM